MLNILQELIKGKDILILGFGREGQSTLRRIRQVGSAASVTIADQAGASPEDTSIKVISGPAYMDTMDDYDLVFKSPGVVLPKDPEYYQCQFTSQMEVFFTAYRDRIIGITGTKGKSTVTTLLYHILKENQRDVVLAGNIGIPAFDILEDIGTETLLVCELSCHQLEYIHVSPHLAVLLNIHEEHLDHYGTMERYVHSKQQIYLHQRPEDLLFCGQEVLPDTDTCQSQIYSVSDQQNISDICLDGLCVHFGPYNYQIPANDIHLLGHHNHIDIAFDYAICRTLGLSDEEFDTALRTYHPLPHRLNLIGTKDGVRYYDDSISTICETTIQALKSIPSVGSILIGGMDRGIEYDDLIRFLSTDSVPHIILMAATGKRIFDEIQQNYPDFAQPERLVLVDTLEEAVQKAKELTIPGTACVLSPAAASYGIFKNFEERGDVFKKLVFES
ncbi:MAG: UDP-N-acetylmuramoyl-L-alanine--D-glutamate ligase [Lachnospiraceae bacterium]|nr:UDP-N-acetylmuramoyl-L-alanine--D-glutamate ligase [Lachnospiraceae bacterium]